MLRYSKYRSPVLLLLNRDPVKRPQHQLKNGLQCNLQILGILMLLGCLSGIVAQQLYHPYPCICSKLVPRKRWNHSGWEIRANDFLVPLPDPLLIHSSTSVFCRCEMSISDNSHKDIYWVYRYTGSLFNTRRNRKHRFWVVQVRSVRHLEGKAIRMHPIS